MNGHHVHTTNRLEHLLLLLIMVLAFYVAFIPHLNYPYPVHIDEWIHLTYSQAILLAGDTTFIDPFYGGSMKGLTGSDLGLGYHLEIGFHLFWGIFQRISGISWLTIYKYFPSVIFMITILSVYVLSQKQGFGLEAAFFASLIPTTVGILGPAFLVPVAMGLLFVPLSLFLAFNFRTGWSYLVLFIFTSFLLAIHAVTAVVLVIILMPYILLNVKDSFKHSLGLTLALAVPFLAPFPWILSLLMPTAKLLFSPQPLLTYVDLPRIIKIFGYLPVLLSLGGTFLLGFKGGKKNYGLILGLLALLLVLVTFFTLHYGIAIVYYRGLMYMMLMLSIVAGAGVAWVRSLRLPRRFATGLKTTWLTSSAGIILCLVLIGLTLAVVIPTRQETPYYHMIDKEDYQVFVWIRENVSNEYEKAILDPWKATAFTAITGKHVYTKIHSYPKDTDKQASAFLRLGCTNTDFLRENGISIVYSRGECDNPNLVEVRKNIYLLKEDEKVK